MADGADVNTKDVGGVTPLHYATSLGHKEVAEPLITKGADVNAKDAFGRTLLDLAIQLGQTEIADLLCKPGGISEPTRP